jgi:hypothetical protein
VVRFGVGMVLVQHVGSTGFDLRIDDGLPELLRLDSLSTFALGLVLGVEFLESFAVAFIKSLGFVGTEEGPVLVVSDSLHEQIWDPKCVE